MSSTEVSLRSVGCREKLSQGSESHKVVERAGNISPHPAQTFSPPTPSPISPMMLLWGQIVRSLRRS